VGTHTVRIESFFHCHIIGVMGFVGVMGVIGSMGVIGVMGVTGVIGSGISTVSCRDFCLLGLEYWQSKLGSLVQSKSVYRWTIFPLNKVAPFELP